jgi:hypothetical protein
MSRYLQTRIRTTVWRSTKNTKVGAEPKLCAGDRLKKEKAIQTSMG